MLTLNDGRSELYQWDTGRKLSVAVDCNQVHYSNKVFGRSIDVDVVDGVAIIPDILLQSDKELTAWAFVGTPENGYTKISKTFRVNRRNKPADYVFTPPEQTTLGELVERLQKIEETQDPDAIKNAVEDYLNANPVKPGATTEQAAQIEQNKNDIADLQTEVDELKESGGNGSGQNPPQDGEDGFSPIATVTQTAEGATISITDKNGTTTATVTNGKDGKDGADGAPGEKGDKGDKGDPGEPGQKGEQGIQGIPGEKGDTGAPGADGVKGDKGDKGDTGAQGEPGKDGAKGKDGVSATHSWNGTILTVTSASGTSSADLKGAKGDKGDTGATGPKGDKGDTGAAGKDGSDGIPGAPGADGSDGYTPVRGVDYWTPDDIAAMDAKLAQMLAERAQLRPEPAESMEWLKANGDTTKLYVMLDKNDKEYGFIIGYLLTEKEVATGPSYTNVLPTAKDADRATVLNGKGYLDDTRLSSSGATSTSNADGMNASGFIFPVKEGDILRIKGLTPKQSAASYIISYDAGNTLVKAYTLSQDGTPAQWVVKNALTSYVDGVMTISLKSQYFGTGFNAIRFSGVIGDGAIVTINEEITESGGTEIVKEYAWANTGIAFVSTDYGPRVTALEEQTAQNTADIAKLKNGVASATPIKDWDAPIYDANIPVFELTEEKPAKTDVRNSSTPDSLYAMYDALMAKHPHYITKTDLGICSDGVNHVYQYTFKDPEQRHQNNRNSETKAKAIIVSGIHYEWAGMFALYYALEEITTNPALRDLKRNVHLIVIPCCSPYTTIYEHKSKHGGQQNANGVEVHRNFEVEFKYPGEGGYLAPGELHHGGTEPLSEVESQIIDNVLKANTDAAFFMTCHNFNLDEYYGVSFLWPSVATAYMCNMGYRLIDKMSQAWMDKYGDELAAGIASYRTDLLESWDTRLGYAQISGSPGTETKQATKYGIQAANVEICERFHVHGTKENPEPILSSFTLSRGTEALLNFILMCFGTYDPKDKKEYAPATV